MRFRTLLTVGSLRLLGRKRRSAPLGAKVPIWVHSARASRSAACSAASFRSRPPDWAENVRQEWLMRLEPLYRIRFTYPEGWAVGLDGGWQQMFFIAEG